MVVSVNIKRVTAKNKEVPGLERKGRLVIVKKSKRRAKS